MCAWVCDCLGWVCRRLSGCNLANTVTFTVIGIESLVSLSLCFCESLFYASVHLVQIHFSGSFS